MDEALEASLLLYVVEASDPTWEAQLEVTREVLREIGADAVPSRLLLNKVDRLDAAAQEALRAAPPEAVLLSAHRPEDVAALRQTLIRFFEASMVEAVRGFLPPSPGSRRPSRREPLRARRHRGMKIPVREMPGDDRWDGQTRAADRQCRRPAASSRATYVLSSQGPPSLPARHEVGLPSPLPAAAPGFWL